MPQPPTEIGRILSVYLLNIPFIVPRRSTFSESSEEHWTATLEIIATATHRVVLFSPEVRPIHGVPYRARPKEREAKEEEAYRMVVMKVVEPSQTEWPLAILISPKENESFQLGVAYRKFSAVTTSDSFLIPFINKKLVLIEIHRYAPRSSQIGAVGRSNCVKAIVRK